MPDFGRVYDTHLAGAVVRVVRQRAAAEPKLIEHLLDRPGWALADELRRVAAKMPMPWWQRIVIRLTGHEPHWMRIAEDVRTGLTGPAL